MMNIMATPLMTTLLSLAVDAKTVQFYEQCHEDVQSVWWFYE
jgi:hypothetical protein